MALDNIDSRELTEQPSITDSANSGLFLEVYDSAISADTSSAKHAEDLPESLDLQEPILVAGWPDSILDAGRRAVDAQVNLVKPITDLFTGSSEANTAPEPEYYPAQEVPSDNALSQFLPSAEQVRSTVETVLKPVNDISNAVQNVGRVVMDALPLNPTSNAQPKLVEETPPVREASMAAAAALPVAAPFLAPPGALSLQTLGAAAAAVGEVLVVPAAGAAAFWLTSEFVNPAIGNLTPDQIETRDAEIRKNADLEIARLYPKGAEILRRRESGETVDNVVTTSELNNIALSAALMGIRESSNSLAPTSAADGDLSSPGAAEQNEAVDPKERYPDLKKDEDYRGPGDVLLTPEQHRDKITNGRDRMNAGQLSVYENEGSTLFKKVDAYLQGFDLATLNFQIAPKSERTSESEDLKLGKIGKEPDDKKPNDEQPFIFDVDNKRTPALHSIFAAGVGIGDVGDGKQLPFGVDPYKKIQPGDKPNELNKIGDPPVKIEPPLFLPLMPDRNSEIVSTISEQLTKTENGRLSIFDKPPGYVGDESFVEKFSAFGELRSRSFGDPELDRPVVPVEDILNGAGGVRSSANFDERLRYLTNGVGYDETKLAEEIRKHPMFPFIYEGLSDAEKAELERLDVKKPVLDKNSPRFDVSMSSNTDILASTAGDADPLKLGNVYFNADSYEEHSTWFGLGPKEYHYFREGELVGKLSQRELDELNEENQSSDVGQSERLPERKVVSIPSDEKPIGRGGQADIYKAPGGDEIYKVFREPGDKAEKSALQERESSYILDRLEVPHARVREIAVTDDGRTVIVEEFIPGKTVKDWSVSARNKPSDADKERVMEQYEDAYRKLADNGYYVKDPNLANAILTPGGQLVLIDVDLGQSDRAEAEANEKLEGIRRLIFNAN